LLGSPVRFYVTLLVTVQQLGSRLYRIASKGPL
jgi:hypothetical protein